MSTDPVEAPLIPDAASEPTISVERTALVMGISRNTCYESIYRGEIPAIRVGRQWRVPTQRLLEMLGLAGRGAA